jgi:glucosamine--fructose-6-phosphate aminotransferase (isomerizing)
MLMTEPLPGDYTLEEITSQGQAWGQLIPLVLQQAGPLQTLFRGAEQVIFTGCGSGLNVAISAAPLFQMLTGLPARAVPAAEIYLFPGSVLHQPEATICVLVSRSGKTTEVHQALEFLHRQGVRTLGITCTEDSPLARNSDLALVLSPVGERSVVTTRSLTGSFLATQLLAAIISDSRNFLDELQRLPILCETHMPTFHDLGRTISQRTDLARFAFVANGPLLGLARESQLKIKEMTLLPADSYPMLDFRHGPQSNVDRHMLVAAMFSDSARLQETHFLGDMRAFGGVTWAICDRADDELQGHTDYLLELNSGLSELARGPLYLPAIQFLAYYRSLGLGLNPDQPPNLSYWVNTSR